MLPIPINATISLIPYTQTDEAAFSWYQNLRIQWLVNRLKRPYTRQEVNEMYHYQNCHGALYYISDNGVLAGDVWLGREDFSIVIAPDHQQKGIGTTVVTYFLKRFEQAGAKEMRVAEVYNDNAGSNRLFQSLGFKRVKQATHNTYYYPFYSPK